MAASTNPNKDIYTTHEVSKLLQVNPRSVINWIEQDLLNSYRTPGGHRRISREDLLAFLRKHQIPVPAALTAEKLKVLIVEDEDSIVNVLAFLRKHQIPVPAALTAEKLKVLIVEDEDSIVNVRRPFSSGRMHTRSTPPQMVLRP